VQDLLGQRDTRKLKSAAGLAGGVGHKGAACGILVGGSLGLALASANVHEDQETIAARSCMYVSEYVRRFETLAQSGLCRDIIRTDFDDERQLRKYILTKSLGCVKLISRATGVLLDIVSRQGEAPDEHCYELNREFADRDFHCAHSVLMLAAERVDANLTLPPHMLIPLDGGIGYSGSTCAALLGGCMVIGLVRGGDTSQGSMLGTFRRMALTLIQGSAAFNRLDLSPANDALLRCAKLADWFKATFHSVSCREIAGVDFADDHQRGSFFEQDGMGKCVAMIQETTTKAVELSQ
jgi:hypothetical protein